MQATASVAAAGCTYDATMSVHGFVLPPRVTLEELMRSAAPLGGVKRKAHAEPDRHINKGVLRPPRLPRRPGVVAGKSTPGRVDTSLERGARIIRVRRRQTEANVRGLTRWALRPAAAVAGVDSCPSVTRPTLPAGAHSRGVACEAALSGDTETRWRLNLTPHRFKIIEFAIRKRALFQIHRHRRHKLLRGLPMC